MGSHKEEEEVRLGYTLIVCGEEELASVIERAGSDAPDFTGMIQCRGTGDIIRGLTVFDQVDLTAGVSSKPGVAAVIRGLVSLLRIPWYLIFIT